MKIEQEKEEYGSEGARSREIEKACNVNKRVPRNLRGDVRKRK